MNPEEDEASGRAALYQMLSIAFYPPKPDVQEFWTEVLSKFVNDEKSEESKAPVVPLELRVEYNRLFVGPGKLPCPPYESVYSTDRAEGEKGTLMGPAVMDAKKRYAESGLEMSKSFTDYPDHIAVELEFMHFLCSKETKSSKEDKENWQRKEKEFFETHLRTWAGIFSDRVLKSTDSMFFRTAASFLKEHVEDEQVFFDDFD